MSLKLYYHPFASFCQKVLIALYESGAEFEPRLIDLGDPADRAALRKVWPLTKFPVLRDEALGVTIPESSVIIGHLQRHYPGTAELIPQADDRALRVQILDRVFDNYISAPLTRIVLDAIRPQDRRDPQGVEEAKALIAATYDLLEAELAEEGWAAGDAFSLADCAAAPALFYANIPMPFADYPRLAAYHARLQARPSVKRTVDEARPYRHLFPLEWPQSYG